MEGREGEEKGEGQEDMVHVCLCPRANTTTRLFFAFSVLSAPNFVHDPL